MDIIGYSNYLIYQDGKVYSKFTNRFLKQHLNRNGYYSVDLWANKVRKVNRIHRLVGIHYIPNPDNKLCIDHIDRNRQNNDISNLRWATHTENMNNTGIRCDNTTGHKNIGYCKSRNKWRYRKGNIGRYFTTLEDAIIFKQTTTNSL